MIADVPYFYGPSGNAEGFGSGFAGPDCASASGISSASAQNGGIATSSGQGSALAYPYGVYLVGGNGQSFVYGK